MQLFRAKIILISQKNRTFQPDESDESDKSDKSDLPDKTLENLKITDFTQFFLICAEFLFL